MTLLFVAWEFAWVIEHAAKALLALKGVNGGYFLRRELQLGGGQVFLQALGARGLGMTDMPLDMR